ncbi:Voltage-dependent anion-selective channel protein 2 [Fasciola hepatica]|uniref:Voltage-dependent anion-selective channel protein 2 n=1 Tax=Fasciola hepatica TaxID=6192 RepID=A0A4E0REE6_FASHE|nr:Voltage-dependent anion-selective channel protein 2 [Fasciola hepatica]
MVTSFKDLGSSARELFDKHFKYGFLNFDFKTKTKNDIAVNCGGKHDTKSQQITGYLESKLKPTKGVSIKTKVDSNWVVVTDVEVEKKMHEGLSHNALATVETESGKKSLQLKNKFKNDMVNVGLDMDFHSKYPQMTGSFVVPVPHFEAFVLGAQGTVDTEPFKLKKHVYTLGFKQDDLRLTASLIDHANIDLSVYQEHKNMEMAFKVGWKKETRESSFAAALQYKISSKSKVKVKIDNNCMVGLMYKLKLDSDTKVYFCSEFDGKNLESGGHRYGLQFSYGD